jgi:hypothetical protein
MEFGIGESYIAYRSDNPLKNFRFTVLGTEDLFFEASIDEGLPNVELWKPYIVRLKDIGSQQNYLEISPYYLDEKTKKARFLVLGRLIEKRKFIRFNVESLNIPVESEYFVGTVENVSLGGMKISNISWLRDERPKEGDEIYVKTRVEGKEYHFIIVPVKVDEKFIASKFEKPAKVTSEFFYHCIKLLKEELAPVSEKRNFRRFNVLHLKIIVDTPLGVGFLKDISLGGLSVKLKKANKVDEDILKEPFSISCYVPSKKKEFVIDVQFIKKTTDGVARFKITKWNEETLKLLSTILDLLAETKMV